MASSWTHFISYLCPLSLDNLTPPISMLVMPLLSSSAQIPPLCVPLPGTHLCFDILIAVVGGPPSPCHCQVSPSPRCCESWAAVSCSQPLLQADVLHPWGSASFMPLPYCKRGISATGPLTRDHASKWGSHGIRLKLTEPLLSPFPCHGVSFPSLREFTSKRIPISRSASKI